MYMCVCVFNLRKMPWVSRYLPLGPVRRSTEKIEPRGLQKRAHHPGRFNPY